MSQRVTILTSVHNPYDTRIFYKQAISLANAGYRITILARGERSPSVTLPSNITLQLLPDMPDKTSRISTTGQFIRKAIKIDTDLYHIHDPELLLGAPILKKATDAAIIYDIHEDVRSQISKKDWIPGWAKQIIRNVYGISEQVCLPFVDELIIAEESYQSRQLYKDAHIVRNYPTFEDIRVQAPDSSDRLELVYLGSISQSRGVHELVEIVSNVSNRSGIKFTFIGGFSSQDIRESITAKVENYGLSDVIEFTGRLPYEQAIQRVAAADIGFALLHKRSNFVKSLPTKLFEYMMCEIPVIVSDVKLWEDIIEQANCGLAVPPKDIDRATNATETLIQNEALRVRLGENGRKAVETTYRWEKEAIKLLSVYDSLAN